MRRNIIRVVSLVASGLLIPLPAAAISVDDMSAWSAPGKPLRMDIAISDLLAAQPSDVQVKIASAADHGRLGLQRPDWADGVRFQILSLPGGKVVARATSSQAISEDNVSFLLDIRALSQGKLQQVGSRLSGSPIAPTNPPASMQAHAPAYQYAPSQRVADVALERSVAAAAPVVKPAPQAKPYVAVADAAPATPKPVVAAKPAAPTPALKPVVAAPALAKPAPVQPAPVQPAPAPAPVAAAPAPAPAPAAPVAAMPVAAEPAPEVVAAEADTGSDDTLTAIHQERAVLTQQLQDAQAQVTSISASLSALDEREAAIRQSQDAPVAADEVAAAVVEPEAAPVAAKPASPTMAGHDAFSVAMLIFIGLMLLGMFVVGKVKSRRQ